MRLLALAFGLLLALLSPALAQEEILSFDADVLVNVDGSVDVTETIIVRADLRDIRRGIFREIPTKLIDDDGRPMHAELDVHDVTRDGQAEPYEIEAIGEGYRRIRIGSADVMLRRGEHTYTIRYTMSRMARHFADHDEIFWNATGNFWAFPIRAASASVRLPEGTRVLDTTAYVGPRYSYDTAGVEIDRIRDGARFATERTLAPGEGLSVVVSFPTGVIVAPQGVSAAGNFLSDNRDVLVPLTALLAVLAYNVLAWSRVGRDPQKGTIIPLFHPPKGFSPALVHYVHNWGWKQSGWTAFTASVFDLGARGLVSIENFGKQLSFSATGKTATDLPAGEKLLLDYIDANGKITVNETTGPGLNTKRAEFVAAIERENRRVYFNNNVGHIMLGLFLGLVSLVAMVAFEVLDIEWLIAAIFAGGILGFATVAIKSLWKGKRISMFIFAVWVVIFAFNAGSALVDMFTQSDFDFAAITALSIVALTIIFAVLMRAPTVQGRKVMDQIDGFRMYMETAEKERLNMDKEPPMTVTRFEAVLPYAIALGVEKPWSHYFETELARNAVADAGSGYNPGWYAGQSFSSGGVSNTFGTIASGMSAAMIAAQPASSSSSGFSSSSSSGGSGGGGGGGGGGGW